MIKHCIIVGSAYKIGRRIALDYFSKDKIDIKQVQKAVIDIYMQVGEDAPISTHYLQTEKEGWKEVGKYDKFFENIKLIESKEEFINILLDDRDLNGIDIAKYILTKISCTHLKLEKLVYMCYAEYLYNENKKLFNDKIYAYRLGPVIETVYEKYKRNKDNLEDDIKVYNEKEKMLPIRSRIISSKDGLKKLESIEKTLERFGEFSASELVSLTHKKNTPWSMSGYGEETYKEMTDDIIKKYHEYELS